MIRSVLLLAALSAVAFGTPGPFNPATFDDTRQSFGDPLLMYTFDECSSGGPYVDKSGGTALVGNLGTDPDTSCPTAGSGNFLNSMNGVHFPGSASGADINGLVSASQFSPAFNVTDFSVEIWFRRETDTAGFEVLFAVGAAQPAGTSFTFTCGTGDVKLEVLLDTLGNSLVLNHQEPDGNCLSVSIAAAVSVGDLHHLVFSLDQPGVNGQGRIYLDGSLLVTQPIFQDLTVLRTPLDGFVYVGSSPSVVNTASYKPFSGDIAMVALYDKAFNLTRVMDLEGAKLPNSPPVVGEANASRVVFEDLEFDITFVVGEDYYDEDVFGSFPDATASFIIDSLPQGQLSDDTGDINTPGHTVVGQLHYNQATPDDFLSTDAFTFSVTDTFGTSASAFMEISFNATNDVPVAVSESVAIPAFQTRQVIFSASDPLDCVEDPCLPASFEPSEIDILEVSTDFGQLRETVGGICNGSNLGPVISGGFNAMLDANLQFVACFEAFEDNSTVPAADGLVGVDTANFTVSDSFDTSSVGTLTIRVTSAISIADTINVIMQEDSVDLINVTDFDDFVTANATFVVELIGVDNRCDDIILDGGKIVGTTPKAGVSGCPRTKEYVIADPLPVEGEIYIENNGELLLVNESGTVIPNNGSRLLFKPNDNFFNAASSPLCQFSLDPQDQERSVCAQTDNTNPFDPSTACTGTLCPDFTSSGFTGMFGRENCTDTECRVEINYQLKIGEALSIVEDPGIDVIVQNVFDSAQVTFLPTTSVAASGLGYLQNTEVLIRTDSGDPLMLTAVDDDSRIVRTVLSLAGVVLDGQFFLQDGYTPPAESNVFVYDACLTTACDVNDGNVEIVGYPSIVNEMLANLVFTHDDGRTNTEERFSVNVRDPNPASVFSIGIDIRLVINFDEGAPDPGLLSDITFVLIVSSVGLLFLCCVMSLVLRATHTVSGYATAARDVLGLDAYHSKVKEAYDADELKIGPDAKRNVGILHGLVKAEAAEENRIICCLGILSVFFPCCCKINKDLHGDTPRFLELQTYLALQDDLAKGRCPDPDDTTHVIDEVHYDRWVHAYDEESGKQFWWNPINDTSQWFSPYPESAQHREAHKVKKTEKHRKKRGPPPKPGSGKLTKYQPHPPPKHKAHPPK